MELFSYKKLDIGTYLYADFTILVRDTGGHWGRVYKRYVAPGIAMMVIFAIGVPIWYFVIMWNVRKRLQVSLVRMPLPVVHVLHQHIACRRSLCNSVRVHAGRRCQDAVRVPLPGLQLPILGDNRHVAQVDHWCHPCLHRRAAPWFNPGDAGSSQDVPVLRTQTEFPRRRAVPAPSMSLWYVSPPLIKCITDNHVAVQAIMAEIVFVGTMAATIYISPFIDYWDNVFSVASMAGVRSLLAKGRM